MSDEESIYELQRRITHLEQHIAEQDSEIYRLSKRVDDLAKAYELQRLKMDALASQTGGDMPANEKPPHY